MLGDDVGAGVQQRHRGLFLLGGIIPGIGPDHLDLGLRVHRADPDRERIDAAHDFRNRERRDIADHIALGLFAGDDSRQIPGLIHPAKVGPHVGRRFEAGAVHKRDIRIFFGDIDRGVHIAKTGGKDDFGALLDQLGNDPLGIGAFRHGFHEDRLDIGHFAFQIFTGLVMRVSPAAVADRPDIHEGDLDFLRRFRRILFRLFLFAAAAGEHQRERHDHRHEDQKFPVFHVSSSPSKLFVSGKELYPRCKQLYIRSRWRFPLPMPAIIFLRTRAIRSTDAAGRKTVATALLGLI